MASKKEALTHLGLLVARAGFGLQLALHHGLEKFQTFAAKAPTFPDPLNLGHKNSLTLTVAAELFCGLALALGLGGRLAALVIAGTVGANLFLAPGGAWRTQELSVLYFAGALALFFTGPGRFSVDGLLLPRLFRRGGGGASTRALPTKKPAHA